MLAAIVIAGCTESPGPQDDAAYLQKVVEWRVERDKTWSESDDPIPAARHAEFLPLKYFPPDPNYVVPAELKLSDTRPIVELPTSTGPLRKMQVVGTLEFTINGEKHSLGALSPAGEPIRALRTVGAKAGFCSDRSIMVRSTSSTAVSVPSPPSLTMCWAESMAL